MKVISELTNDIPVREMKAGEIGIITKWGNIYEYEGKIVQLINEDDNSKMLIQLGDPENYWINISSLDDTCRVRILPKGTLLEI